MKRTTILTMLLIPLLAPPAALAEPAWGGSCLSCHDQLLTDRVFIVDEDATTNPDESGTGAVDRGPLPTFKVYAGKTRALHAEIAGLSADDTYALEIKRLRFPGVEENGYLDHAADCTWPDWGLSTGYYTKPVIRYRWGVDPAEFAFDLTANPEADADTYDLVFAVAGKLTDGGGLYYSE
ncbi:MAG: hypothetical protein GY842_09810, partial [bacterium]|nr:hypothetical protein [bacterium]